MAQTEVLINGVRAGWGSCEFVVLGRVVTGITEISIESDQDKDNEYGSGNEPVHQGISNKKYSLGMKLFFYEVSAVLELLPEGKDFTDLPPSTVNVVFTPIGDDKLRRIDIAMCQFKSSGLGIAPKQGDKSISSDMKLICGKPIYKK